MSAQLHVDLIGLTPTPAAVTARTVDRASLREAIESGIQRTRRAVTAGHVPTSGAPFVRYLSYSDEFDIEIGLPLDGPHIVPGFRTTILPGGTAASVWHLGTYEELRFVFDELRRWVESNATPAGDPWEWYWTPGDADPPRTQIVWPVTTP